MSQETKRLMEARFDKVFNEVLIDDSGKYDFQANLRDIQYDDSTGHIVINNSDEFTLTATAENQIYSTLGMPAAYARKLPPELVKPHFDYWKSEIGDKEFLVRAKSRKDDKLIRAFLSNRYNILDNKDVAIAFNDALSQEKFSVVNFNITDDMFNARVVFDGEAYNNITGPDGKTNRLFAGLHVSNGETGNASARIDLIVWEEWCSNGAIKQFGGNSLLAKKHVGITDDLTELFGDSMDGVKDKSSEFIEQFLSAQRDILKVTGYEALEGIAERRKQLFSGKFLDGCKRAYDERPINTRYGVSSAITQAVQELPFNRRLPLEQLAGDIITNQFAIK